MLPVVRVELVLLSTRARMHVLSLAQNTMMHILEYNQGMAITSMAR